MYVRSLLKSQAQTPRSKNPFPNRATKPAGSSEDESNRKNMKNSQGDAEEREKVW